MNIFFISPVLNDWNIKAFPDLIEKYSSKDRCIAYCAAERGFCTSNVFGSKEICSQCRVNAEYFISTHFPESVSLPVVPDATHNEDIIDYDSKSILHYSAISTLNSRFRPSQKLNMPKYEAALEKFLKFGLDFIAGLEKNKKNNYFSKKNKFFLFNGRTYPSSLVRQFCLDNESFCFCSHEYLSRSDEYEVYEETTIHDINDGRKQIKKLKSRGLSREEMAEGEKFFKEQPQKWNVKAGRRELTPAHFLSKDERPKISVFLSSEDELSSLGPDWASSFTDDILATVEQLLSRYQSPFFIIRMHPNQRGQGKQFAYLYKKLERKFSNVHVVMPHDRINSYAIMSHSDAVISFGSTISVEATYLGKVSILLGAQKYDCIDVVYAPKSFTQLDRIIDGLENLPAKSPNNAVVYGAFVRRRGMKIKNVSMEKSRGYLGSNPLLPNPGIRFLFAKFFSLIRLGRPDFSFKYYARLMLIKLNLYDLNRDILR